MPNYRITISVSCLFAACVACGCGGDPLGRIAISGAVKVNETPVTEGNIRFDPLEGATMSGGTMIKDGRYSMETEAGLPAGKYRVVINAPVPGTGGELAEGAMPGDELPAPKELIPPEWNENSQHTIEVKPDGPFEFNFAVTAKK